MHIQSDNYSKCVLKFIETKMYGKKGYDLKEICDNAVKCE